MPKLKTYDLFISHAWRFSENYFMLEELLRNAGNFKWRNYSVPVDEPIVDPDSPVGKAKLTQLLINQVKPVNCVIIIGDGHAAQSDWVIKEIEIAQVYNKPILGIYPPGYEQLPEIVKNASHEIAHWDVASIISAIRKISL
jgi:hypothetical protein